MSAVSQVYLSLAEAVSYYSHTEAVLTRLHSKGWVEQIVELFSDIKQEEEKFAKREIKKMQRSAGQGDLFDAAEQLALNSKIFKSNLALIVASLLDSLWETQQPDPQADQSLSKSSAGGRSSQLGHRDNCDSVRGSEKQPDRSVRGFVAASFRKDQPKEDSRLLDSKDSRSEMVNPHQRPTASTSTLKDHKPAPHKAPSHKTPATQPRPEKKEQAAGPPAAHKYTSHRPAAQVPQPQVLKVKASAAHPRDSSAEALPQPKPRQPLASQADSQPTRRLASPRNKPEEKQAVSKPSKLLVPENKKVIRGSRSLERPSTDPLETPKPREDSQSRHSRSSKLREDSSEQPALPEASPQQPSQPAEDRQPRASDRQSRSPFTDSEKKKAEDEFNRRLVISVKKKLLGNTGPLDVS